MFQYELLIYLFIKVPLNWIKKINMDLLKSGLKGLNYNEIM